MRSAFTGAFAPYICGLIEKKQALGYDYHGSACILRTFDEFCREQFPNETCLTAELAMKWAEQFKTEKNLSRLNRVSVIRELAKYMNSVGEQAYLLPLQLTKKSGRHIPYIYSKEDLSKLFKEIDSLQPSLRAPTKHLVVSVIFRLIYCCGLRPVEARRLRREDVNLFDGTVNILESKGHKDRIVVLSEDMLELCRNYDLRVEKIYPHRKYFFQSPSVRGDGMYSMEWIIPTFRRFLQTAGISGYGEIRPRLYDLRHTFATHRLYQWVKEGKDINACLAYLSEYILHGEVQLGRSGISLCLSDHLRRGIRRLDVRRRVYDVPCDQSCAGGQLQHRFGFHHRSDQRIHLVICRPILLHKAVVTTGIFVPEGLSFFHSRCPYLFFIFCRIVPLGKDSKCR